MCHGTMKHRDAQKLALTSQLDAECKLHYGSLLQIYFRFDQKTELCDCCTVKESFENKYSHCYCSKDEWSYWALKNALTEIVCSDFSVIYVYAILSEERNNLASIELIFWQECQLHRLGLCLKKGLEGIKLKSGGILVEKPRAAILSCEPQLPLVSHSFSILWL